MFADRTRATAIPHNRDTTAPLSLGSTFRQKKSLRLHSPRLLCVNLLVRRTRPRTQPRRPFPFPAKERTYAREIRLRFPDRPPRAPEPGGLDWTRLGPDLDFLRLTLRRASSTSPSTQYCAFSSQTRGHSNVYVPHRFVSLSRIDRRGYLDGLAHWPGSGPSAPSRYLDVRQQLRHA
jgi:hypothetical protein